MAKIAQEFEANSEVKQLRPSKLLQAGYVEVVYDRSIYAGGSTACVAVARDDGVMDVANLGDSGFVHLRLNAVQHHSEPQTHAFNTPYQLSLVPPRQLAQSRAFGGMPLQDLPKDASVTSHKTRNGDVLVFASDGVWDNLSSQDLLRLVSRHMTAADAWTPGEAGITVGKRLGELTEGIDERESDAAGPRNLQSTLASAIAGEAKHASVNAKLDGPFAKEMQRLYPEDNYRGGKADDICVVVAIVVEA
ncbi:MAG: hypothetical protein M1832_000613 [Thelocarpon impressellum]|nr:MAG: hypothetical protein M1832_000613 [Thelocarpon impressellum]